MKRLSLFFIFMVSSFSAQEPAFGFAEGTGLKFSGATDIVGNIESKDETKSPRRLDIREAEFGVYGPIDHGFDGNLFFAAHNENGAYYLEVHEAYLASSKLLPNVRLKGGKFFLGVGRLNQFHRHDWPFLSTPKAHQTYFDAEAASDTGLQANILIPFMPIFTEIGLGVTNGWTYGHAHVQGTRPIKPTHYARLANYFSVGDSGGLQTGLNYLGRHSRVDGEMKIFGLDLVAKWRDGKIVSWLFQAELYGRNLRAPGAAMERTYGGYLYGQRHLFGSLDFGLRLDGYTLITTGTRNLDYSFVPTFIYRHSEFAQFKTAYQIDFEKRAHKDSQVNRAFQIQAVFLLGDHPSHDF